MSAGRQARADLADRVRVAVSGRAVEEKRMFGTLAFMVDGRLLVCAWGEGDLLVRIDPDRHDELIARPGAAQAFMGPGRSMGPSWLSVAADAVADDAALSFWIDAALDYAASAA